MSRKCPGTNIPSVNEDPIECCNLISSNCVVMAEAVPCLQLGKGKTLTEAFERLCKNLRPGAGGNVPEKTKFYHTHLLFEPDFAIPAGYPLLSGAAITVGSAVTTKLAQLDMTGISPGDYLMTLELNLDASPDVQINIAYELRKNGIRIPYSTRVFRLTGGTPADEQSHVGVSAPVSIGNTTDTVEVWIVNHYVGNGSLVVAGGSLTALRK